MNNEVYVYYDETTGRPLLITPDLEEVKKAFEQRSDERSCVTLSAKDVARINTVFDASDCDAPR